MRPLRFGVLVPPDAPLPVLAERWRRVEEYGFDHLYVPDHIADPRNPEGPWFAAWTVLAAMAVETSSVRIGTLVANPVLRPPALLAREAATVDHLCGGRLEIGIGTGVWGVDHRAVGEPYWPPAERAQRFREYVGVVDGLLRRGDRFGFEGLHHRVGEVPVRPRPLQQPRPPLTLGGQSPTVLRVAAEVADCWNTHGRFGATALEVLDLTRRQNDLLDEMCVASGRDPSALRRSLLLQEALDAWAAPDAFENAVGRFVEAGVGEFVVFWPGESSIALLERAASVVVPAFRRG